MEQEGGGPTIPRRGVREVRDPQRYNESFGGTRARWVANVSLTGVHAGPVLPFLVSLDISDTYETGAQHLLGIWYSWTYPYSYSYVLTMLGKRGGCKSEPGGWRTSMIHLHVDIVRVGRNIYAFDTESMKQE